MKENKVIGEGKEACRTGVRRSRGRSRACSQSRSKGHNDAGWYSRGYVPHLDVAHTIQHITYRLADALPLQALEQMKAEVNSSIKDDVIRQIELRKRIEAYIDKGYGCCILKNPGAAEAVINTWFRFDGDRYRLIEWVVMPNHCHVLIETLGNVPLGKIVLSWKNYTARVINQICNAGEWEECCRTGVRRSQAYSQGRSPKSSHGQVWQREYWDRYIRDDMHLEAVRAYIHSNPVAAGLVKAPEDWLWGSAGYRRMRES